MRSNSHNNLWRHRAALRYKRRQLAVPFYMGPAHTSEPTAAADYEDSRKVERVYQVCLKQTNG